MGGFSQNAPSAEETGRWRPFAIAAVMIVVVGGLIYTAGRRMAKPATTQAIPPAYASNLSLGELHLSTAENFVGGHVTYLEGKLTNQGDETLIGAQMEIIFRNDIGEVVDKQVEPPLVAASPLGNPDWVTLSAAPLGPGKIADFRLTFEHISSDWNQGYPEMRFLTVQTK
ncbi:MAG: hypothetical protein ABSD20_08995 [Terriglobales bacterium]|jgi:hypothetical protein